MRRPVPSLTPAFAPTIALALALGLLPALLVCRGRGGAAEGPGSPRELATGGCLGPFCLGRPIAEADRPEQAAAVAGRPATDVTCWRLEGTDVAAFADKEGPEAIVRGVLATSLPYCGHHPSLASATAPDIVDCRGVRLGDPAAFVTKMHRQARAPEAGADLWPEAPDGVTRLADICTPGADDAHHTMIYLKDDRVVGLAIGRR